MNPADDLVILAQQEALLRFPAFDANTAWQLGTLLRNALLARNAGGSIEIALASHVLFACVTPGATPGQADWIRRKRNTVHRFARSSYAIGRTLERDGDTLEARHGLSLTDYAAHGGGFPLFLTGTGCIGSIVLSGLPQRDDHNLVVTAIAEQLDCAIPQLTAAG
ncbi:MAG: heme-degrading domain-containing protein [Acidobacteria bacterium]|nr:heme-degrading domain-containing protein [Acidobacteriota bacterium]